MIYFAIIIILLAPSTDMFDSLMKANLAPSLPQQSLIGMCRMRTTFQSVNRLRSM